MDIQKFQDRLTKLFHEYYLTQKSKLPGTDAIDEEEYLTRCGINAAMFSLDSGMRSLRALYAQQREATVGDQAVLIQGVIDVFLGCVTIISTLGVQMDDFCGALIEIVEEQMASVREPIPNSDDLSVEEEEDAPVFVRFTNGEIH